MNTAENPPPRSLETQPEYVGPSDHASPGEEWSRRAKIASYIAPFAIPIIAVLSSDRTHAQQLDINAPTPNTAGHEFHMDTEALTAIRGLSQGDTLGIGTLNVYSKPQQNEVPRPNRALLPFAMNRGEWTQVTPIVPPKPTDVIPSPTITPSPSPTARPYSVVIDRGEHIYSVPDGDALRREADASSYEYKGQDNEGEGGFVAVKDGDKIGFIDKRDVEVDPAEAHPMAPEADVDMEYSAEIHRHNDTDGALRQQVIMEPVRIEGRTDVTLRFATAPAAGTFIEFSRGEQVKTYDQTQGLMLTGIIRDEGIRILAGNEYQFEGHNQNSDPIPMAVDGSITIRFPTTDSNHVVLDDNPENIIAVRQLPTDTEGVLWNELLYINVENPPHSNLDLTINIKAEADHTPRKNNLLVQGAGLKEAADDGAGRAVSNPPVEDMSDVSISPHLRTYLAPLAQIVDLANISSANFNEVGIDFAQDADANKNTRYPRSYGVDAPVPEEQAQYARYHGFETSARWSGTLSVGEIDKLANLGQQERRNFLERRLQENIERGVKLTSENGYFRIWGGWWHYNAQSSPYLELYDQDHERFLLDIVSKARALKPDIKIGLNISSYNLNNDFGFCHPDAEICLTPDVIGHLAEVTRVDQIESVEYNDPTIPLESRLIDIKAIHSKLPSGTRIRLAGIGFSPIINGDRHDYGPAIALHSDSNQLYYALLAERIIVDRDFYFTSGGYYPDFYDGPAGMDNDDLRVNGHRIRSNPTYDWIRGLMKDPGYVRGSGIPLMTVDQWLGTSRSKTPLVTIEQWLGTNLNKNLWQNYQPIARP